MTALMISRKRPKVTMVMGKVRKTRIGLTVILKRAKTTATTMAVQNPSTAIPGRILARRTTAIAESKSFTRDFISEFFKKDKVFLLLFQFWNFLYRLELAKQTKKKPLHNETVFKLIFVIVIELIVMQGNCRIITHIYFWHSSFIFFIDCI